MCPRERFVVCYIREDIGGAKFRKLLQSLKSTDNAELCDAKWKDIVHLNSGGKLFSQMKHKQSLNKITL